MGNVALITGTASGIGQATAKIFTDCGIQVVGLDILDCPIELEDNPLYTHYVCDITDEFSYPDFSGLEFKWIVNNAGTENPKSAIGVNLEALFIIEDKFVTEATKCVVNVAASEAYLGIAGREYTASKGGMISYTRQLAKRMAEWGGRCVSISPGPVATHMNDMIIWDDEKYNAVRYQNLLHRWIEPSEIADAIQFLCTCTCITGIDLLMDCGEHINQVGIY